jgi:hypothetical protein
LRQAASIHKELHDVDDDCVSDSMARGVNHKPMANVKTMYGVDAPTAMPYFHVEVPSSVDLSFLNGIASSHTSTGASVDLGAV